MSFSENDVMRALYARIDDLDRRAERGELSATAFLSPREQKAAERYITLKGRKYLRCGGYADAERRKIYILPDYMEFLADCDNEGASPDALDGILSEFGYASNMSALRVAGSGYRQLTHRDFLGSLLGIGLERDVIGDILVLGDDGREAVIFCDGEISRFIESELSHVANDKVCVSRVSDGEWQVPPRRVQAISDTVASARLDAVVAALCNLSREKAQSAVRAGLVEIDFEGEERPDRAVSAPSVISVRGFGRFRVLSVDGRTRKGRYRLDAEKYV